MTSVDRSAPCKPSAELWGYWVPEPSLLVGPATDERVARYLMNWLRLREAWIYLLGLPDTPATRVAPQWWRDFLNGATSSLTPDASTRRAKRLENVKQVFSRAFLMDDYDERPPARLEWFHHRLASLDVSLAPLVLWEVFELGFHYELLALDRWLVQIGRAHV